MQSDQALLLSIARSKSDLPKNVFQIGGPIVTIVAPNNAHTTLSNQTFDRAAETLPEIVLILAMGLD